MSGIGLIEVLIAVVILAFGMLGIAALQAASLRNGESSLERSQATAETYTILDAMRANSTHAKIGDYNLAKTCDVPDAGATLVENDLHNWITSLHRRLGGPDIGGTSCGEITCGALSCKVTVYWDDSRGTNGATDATAYNVVTQTRL